MATSKVGEIDKFARQGLKNLSFMSNTDLLHWVLTSSGDVNE
jgi:hypothetical protein